MRFILHLKSLLMIELFFEALLAEQVQHGPRNLHLRATQASHIRILEVEPSNDPSTLFSLHMHSCFA
jgi:hypothetical protein